MTSRVALCYKRRMTVKRLKIGTRGSPLALKQTAMVQAAIGAAHPLLEMDVVIIRTSGDWRPQDGEVRLSEIEGGKGLFAREIEQALLDGRIDCAVHSMKDMPSFLPDGLDLDHVLPREDPRDAFICHTAASYRDLPEGAKVGTSSLRRQALMLARRPDLKVETLRGNVQTRLVKLAEGQVDATFLAMAGLNRLGIDGDFIHPVPVDDMLPACGQGIVCVETRRQNHEVRAIMDAIHDEQTGYCGIIERAALQVLDGSCHTPIGAYARYEGGSVVFDVMVASYDGSRIYHDQSLSPISGREEAVAVGRELAMRVKAVVPKDIFI